MDSAGGSEQTVTALKVVVAGAFGVGKTTFVGAASDITPLRTEEVMTAASVGVDDLSATPDKQSTTVAMDFGRLDLDPGDTEAAGALPLYLFGTPGQYRFWFMWDELCRGAVGAVVLVDTRRLVDSFPVLDYFDRTDLPVIVAVNGFDGEFPHGPEAVREALTLDAATPVVTCDARDRHSATETLAHLVGHALTVRGGATGREPQRVESYRASTAEREGVTR
ncbi:GTP-binding protein [Actinomycetospora termitidis]|uniref:ATP/GTP-binding protein n=1 Tax=Actinomycetospora termitidis TaxID=3053470 RepID=A0ABT7MK55_9PSEU|nr:ATP/GTP-binding protein [Actinomycetospora sp. Odt1-22]MDL5160307.1 ATP/GTP-binding protein [Actinomycetospora sp. Odt1-22]